MFIFQNLCPCACVSLHEFMCTIVMLVPEKEIGSLELEVQVAVNLMWGLRTKSRSFARKCTWS